MILNDLVEEALSLGAEKAEIFSVNDVAFDERTLLKCLYGCGGRHHYCPGTGDSVTVKDYIQMIKKYDKGILICTDNLKDGQKISLALEKTAFLAGHYFAIAATECTACSKCSKMENEPCRDPSVMRIPLYALGIDVYKTVRNIGWTLEVVQNHGMDSKNITAVFVE